MILIRKIFDEEVYHITYIYHKVFLFLTETLMFKILMVETEVGRQSLDRKAF